MKYRPTRTMGPDEQPPVDAGTLLLTSAQALEERSVTPGVRLYAQTHPELVASLIAHGAASVSVNCNGAQRVLNLHDASELGSLISDFPAIALDVSGLDYSCWAPLLKIAMTRCDTVDIVYAEPARYRDQTAIVSSSWFNLTDVFDGAAPLPGFANLTGSVRATGPDIFVPLLGFEGARARHLAGSLESTPRVIPIVGLPGFQHRFPSFTLACNLEFLEESGAFGSIRYARANCPFEVLEVLRSIRAEFPDSYLYLAPVGTKPHGVGAVLFALESPELTELVYDHPRRSAGRTSGIGTVHVYRVREGGENLG